MVSTPAGCLRRAGCGALVWWVAALPALAQQPIEKVRDPVYGEVLFEVYTQDYFSALIRTLVELQRQDHPPDPFGGRLGNHRDDAQLLLGGLSLAYGMPAAAQRTFDELLARRTDPALQRKAWYLLGRLAHQQDRRADAERMLRRALQEAAPGEAAPRRLLLAQVLMEQERFDEAADELAVWQGGGDLEPYVYYNRGVALIRSGRRQAGIESLAQVTTPVTPTGERAALADRARLALGFEFLENSEPLRAQQFLESVRLEGPYSNRALLGAGWAASEQHQYRNALVPWQELRDRDTPESAVLEANLAIPYAYSKLALHGRAAEGYRQAEDKYLDEQRRIDAALAAVETGELIKALIAQTESLRPGPHRRVNAAPVEETRYFVTLLASNGFRRALRNFRDLRALRENLLVSQRNMEAYDDMLETRRLRYEQVLPAVEARLASVDIEALRTRRDELRARLRGYLESEDIVALASTPQQDQYARLTALEEKLDELPYTPEVEDATLTQSWRARRELNTVSDAIDRAERLAQRVDDARVAVPASFSGYDSRVAGLRSRITALSATTGQLLAAQGKELQTLARARLREYRARLGRYVLHAKFGQAQNLDMLYETRGGGPVQ
jgi:tetratricopeptide (TPR) repeat protein